MQGEHGPRRALSPRENKAFSFWDKIKVQLQPSSREEDPGSSRQGPDYDLL